MSPPEFEYTTRHGEKRIIAADTVDTTSEPRWVVFRRDGRIIDRVLAESIKTMPRERRPTRTED